jgi:integrase
MSLVINPLRESDNLVLGICQSICQKRTVARPKKTIRFILNEIENPGGSKSWKVSGTKTDGTRVRQNFNLKSEALQTLADLEGETTGRVIVHRNQRTRLTADQLADAEAAMLASPGRKLSDLVTHYLSLETRAKSEGISLDVALSFVDGHYHSEIKAVSIMTACDEFVKSRPPGSRKTVVHYESSPLLLVKPDPNKPLHTFTVSDIEGILGRYKNVNSRRTYRRAFSAFFNWAVRHHYSLENPCARLDKLPKDVTQIAILSQEEIQRLLYAALRYQNGAAAAPVAIALFAGLRPSEIADLKTEDIGKTKIKVSGGKLRRTLNRAVPIPANLAAWLEKYPFNGLPEGWAYKMKRLKCATKATNWVQDILRHTSITYQVERDSNEALTAFNCGTSVAMMDRHYRHTVDDEKAVADFWSLTPAKVLAKKPAVALPTVRRISWPTKTALRKLVWQKPLVHGAAEIGVSDVALKKHCVKVGIDLPPAGHWIRQQRDSAR